MYWQGLREVTCRGCLFYCRIIKFEITTLPMMNDLAITVVKTKVLNMARCLYIDHIMLGFELPYSILST